MITDAKIKIFLGGRGVNSDLIENVTLTFTSRNYSTPQSASSQSTNLMLVIPMCLSITYKYKIEVKTHQFIIK